VECCGLLSLLLLDAEDGGLWTVVCRAILSGALGAPLHHVL
jgi:hypothetical protein